MRKKQRDLRLLCGLLLVCVLSPPGYAASRKLIPLGIPAGVQMTAEGVVVADFSPVDSAAGTICPGEQAGIQTGDVLQTANGVSLNSSEQFAALIERSGGKPMEIKGCREEEEFSVTIQPVKSTHDGGYKLGMLIRDSMAGIGTITYVDAETGEFGMLGHAVCDTDTGARMPLQEGRLLSAQVVSVVQGVAGQPGELVGAFDEANILGKLNANTSSGLFGTLTSANLYREKQAIEVAKSEEVHTGDAVIVTCTQGSIPKKYDISIEKVQEDSGNGRDLTIRVTDKALLDQTGGIVPGMSGSPILQDGKLVGAVTHVLIDHPDKGYGILLEDMIENTAENE